MATTVLTQLSKHTCYLCHYFLLPLSLHYSFSVLRLYSLHTEQSFIGTAVAHGGTTKSFRGRQRQTPHRERKTQRKTVRAANDPERERGRGEDQWLIGT